MIPGYSICPGRGRRDSEGYMKVIDINLTLGKEVNCKKEIRLNFACQKREYKLWETFKIPLLYPTTRERTS